MYYNIHLQWWLIISLLLQIAGIKGKALQDRDYKRPVAFPYKKDTYGFFASLVDRTTHRFDENSKIVVVDGPIAAGKDKFAKVGDAVRRS